MGSDPLPLGLLGLARRSGAVSVGVAETRRLLRSGRLRAVLFAGDASPAQLEKIRRLAGEKGVPVRWAPGKDGLGKAVGGGPVSVVGIMAGTFAEKLLRGFHPEPPRSKGAEGGPLGEQEDRK